MSQITVQIYSNLREKVGREKVSVDADNVKDALEELVNELGEKFREQLYENGEIKNYYIFLLNGHYLDIERLSQIKLSPGDTLYILPPLAGG
ncbi:MAG: MoaD family protein [Deltaproteobacteria bacterium]|nr:MAG: MoaD family protein [Deltaproteobacteria bacterium]